MLLTAAMTTRLSHTQVLLSQGAVVSSQLSPSSLRSRPFRMREYDVTNLAGRSSFSTTHKFYLAAANDLVI